MSECESEIEREGEGEQRERERVRERNLNDKHHTANASLASARRANQRRVSHMQDLLRTLPRPQVPVVSAHVLRGVHRSAHKRAAFVQVLGLSRVLVSDMPQEDGDTVGRCAQAQRQLPHQQPQRAAHLQAPLQDTHMRHMQAGLAARGRRHVQVRRVPEVHVSLVCGHSSANESDQHAQRLRARHREGHHVQAASERTSPILL